MNLNSNDVKKIALLARLDFSEKELDAMTHQLGQIVGYVEQLQELDTEGIQPLAHGVEINNVFADDKVRPSLSREAALSNAPSRDDSCYRVPAVLGSSTS